MTTFQIERIHVRKCEHFCARIRDTTTREDADRICEQAEQYCLDHGLPGIRAMWFMSQINEAYETLYPYQEDE